MTKYEIDEKTKTITKCSKGIIPIHARVKNGQTVAFFLKEACEMCELKNRCYCKKTEERLRNEDKPEVNRISQTAKKD